MNEANYESLRKQISGGVDLIRSIPLISFETLVDMRYGLVKYILKSFRNPDIFDLDKYDKLSTYEMIDYIYKSDKVNPLECIARKDILDEKSDFLEECYQELITTEENYINILSNSITTEIIRLVNKFFESGDIIPVILCYNKYQRDIILNHNALKKFEVALFDNLSVNIESRADIYSQFYFRYIEESEAFLQLTGKTFYVSTCGTNLNEQQDDIKDTDLIGDIIKSGNKLNIFDMYNMSIIEGRYNK